MRDTFTIHLSIHPSSSALSGTGSREQLSEQGHSDFPLPGHFLQLFREDPKAFPGQPRDIVTPACPRSSSGSLPGGTCQEHLPREASRGHLIQMPEPSQLAPLNVEKQWLYSELLPGDRAPHSVFKGAPHRSVVLLHGLPKLFPHLSFCFRDCPCCRTLGLPVPVSCLRSPWANQAR